MSHAHNFDTAFSSAAFQSTRMTLLGAKSSPNMPTLSGVIPALISRIPKMTKISKDSPLMDITCGSVAGITSKFIEHPFDTIKVRLQSQPIDKQIYGGTWDCVKKTMKSGSIYSGISSPLVGAIAENAILFLSYSYTLSKISPIEPNLSCQIAAGAVSGACVSFLLTPVELLKCRIQVSGGSTIHLLKTILMKEGLKGMYHGYSGTFLRETVGGGAWFGTYEYVHRRLNDPLIAGAIAGIAFNSALFPADVIKSIQQTQLKPKSFNEIGRTLYQQKGFKGLYRGFGITAARAGPSSAMIFWTYEKIKDFISI